MNEIVAYMHCKNCQSGHHAVGFTEKGLQVWCENCDMNILHIELKDKQLKTVE